MISDYSHKFFSKKENTISFSIHSFFIFIKKNVSLSFFLLFLDSLNSALKLQFSCETHFN